MAWETVQIRVDDAIISGDDVSALVEPVWWTANIYDGPAKYEASLSSFTRPQRLFHAIEWYRAEVNNGGHDQFYSNSTGIVWQNALAGFELLGLEDFASILRTSAQRLGGNPPLDRQQRQQALSKLAPNFDDLDSQFFKLESSRNLDAEMLRFARSHKSDFLYEGVVRRPAKSQK